MPSDSRISQLDQELRMTRFYLEKSQLLQEEYLLNLKQSQVEVDKLRKKLDLSTQEFFARDSEYSQHRAQLEAKNVELAERLRSYENLDRDMDQIVLDATQIDDEDESRYSYCWERCSCAETKCSSWRRKDLSYKTGLKT